MNGRNPYTIEAEWEQDQLLYQFSSESIWYDPSIHIKGKSIDVLIDPKNPKIYWMDTTFLPKLA